MKKLLFLLGFVLLTINVSCAFEIVYPTKQDVEINSPVTFFTGYENPELELKINDEVVKLHESGGFLYPVKLEKGENVFNIDNGELTKTYTITNNQTYLDIKKETPITNYSSAKYFVVSKPNTPLRAEPVDGGINRLQHFDNGVLLKIVGEKDEFYMVELAQDSYAWIAKTSVVEKEDIDYSLTKIQNYTYNETKEKRVYTIKLEKKVPYILTENRIYKIDEETNKTTPSAKGLDLDIYNVDGFLDNIYKLHIDRIGKLCGYKIYYTPSNELVVEVKTFNKYKTPLQGRTITVDPGHGGTELGAIGCLEDCEKDINLAIALKLKDYLIENGATVIMTRDCDCDLSLNDRVKISQDNNSDAFISIHNNSIPDNKAFSNPTGTSTYYYYDQSRELADKLQDELTKTLNSKNEGVIQQSFAVVRNTQSPAVLVEVGYMIVPEDMVKLKDENYQDDVAKSMLNAITRYFDEL